MTLVHSPPQLVCAPLLMKSVPILLLLLLAWVRMNTGYYILITNHAGNYNVSTSLPAWQRLDAANAPAFIVADDITIPIQLTRCDELTVDITLLFARGTIPSEPVNVTFWILPTAAMTGRFDPTQAVASQTFAAPSEGSWSPDSAVRTWSNGLQTFYVVTPRFRINDNVALRGNVTYWIAMLIGQERRISPADSTFNTPRWLLTGTPSSPLGSAASLKGVDLNGTMFRAFPGLANWSNVAAVETAGLPFLTNTGTVSLTHQMSFTAYVSSCYAPANVVIPSTRNFTTLPSPTAYTAQTPAITIQWPSPPPPAKNTPAPLVMTNVPTPIKNVAPSPAKIAGPSPVKTIPSVLVPPPPILPPLPVPEEAAPIPVEQTTVPNVQPPPSQEPHWAAPVDSPTVVDHITSSSTTSVLTDPLSSPAFIALLVIVIVLVIIIAVGIFMFVSRRYRARIAEQYNKVHDETKEVELTDDDASVQLSVEDSGSASGEFQTRTYNSSLKATDLEQQNDADMMVTVPVDPVVKRSKN